MNAESWRCSSLAELREYMAPRVRAFESNKARLTAGQDDGSLPL